MQLGDPAFVSSKCVTAIPTSGAVPLDALIGVTLDPAVTAIEYLANIDVHGFQLPLDAVVITRGDDGRFLLNIVDESQTHDLDEVGTRLLALDQHGIGCIDITLAELRAEPAFSDRRRIWACRGIPVNDGVARSIISVLRRHDEIRLGELADRIATPIAIETIFALACRDLVALDLDAALSSETIVRLGHPPIFRDPIRPATGGPM